MILVFCISASFCAIYLIFKYVHRNKLVIVLSIVSSLYCLTPFSSFMNFHNISSFMDRASFPFISKCDSVSSRAFLVVGQSYITCLKSSFVSIFFQAKFTVRVCPRDPLFSLNRGPGQSSLGLNLLELPPPL